MSKKEVKILTQSSNLNPRSSNYSLLDEISDEYIRYDKDLDLEKGVDSPRGSVDSDVMAINERKESGDFWRTFFKEQHVITEGRAGGEQKRKRRANGKTLETFGVTDWEGWWLRSSAWRRVEGILVAITFLFAVAQIVTAMYLFIHTTIKRTTKK